MRLLPEEMNHIEKVTLQNCRNVFLEDLDPTMSFLSQLYCARVITEDQKDRVEGQRTRQDKVITLLDILPRRGPRAFKKFIEVLETDYNWIKERLEDELQAQQYQKKIMDAIGDRMNGEFIRDKDYINKIVRETILPLILQTVRTSPAGSPYSKLDQPLKDIITNHLLPLVGITHSKNKPQGETPEISFEKTIELFEELREKCTQCLGFSSESSTEDSLPYLIDKRMVEFKSEIALLRKENKKAKKTEEKLQAENSKFKNESMTLKADIKKIKSDSQGSKNELKKLKDEAHKFKSENSKLKQENTVLKSALDDAGMDLRISTDFC